MSNSEHSVDQPGEPVKGPTPGPWHVDNHNGNTVWAGDKLLTATECRHPEDAPEARANARLMAAAPTMLSALRWVAAYPHSNGKRTCMGCFADIGERHLPDCPVANAIAAATGEG